MTIPYPTVGTIDFGDPRVAIGTSICLAVAVAGFVWSVLGIVTSRRRGDLDYFEQQRRERLRNASWTYRTFEPLIDQLAALKDPASLSASRLTHSMQLVEELPPWTANEFVAARQIEGAIAGILFALLLAMRANLIVAVIAFGLIFVFWQSMGTAKIRDDAKRRVTVLKRRLPYAIDLMALMMEAGAGFQESLHAIVQENHDHPLGEEFDGVLSEVELGRTRREALEKLQERLNDDDINEIVFSIIKGEELGTPLAVILRTQADQLRLKRSQWAEKAAGQAQVQIAFPGLLVMVACLLVIVAPFVLKAFNAL